MWGNMTKFKPNWPAFWRGFIIGVTPGIIALLTAFTAAFVKADTIISNGLTLTIPDSGADNWYELFRDEFAEPISGHDHTGGGNGLQLGVDAFSDNALGGAKIRLENDTYLRGRAFNGLSDINVVKVNTSNQIQFGTTVVLPTLSGTVLQGNGGTGFTGSTANGQLLVGNTSSGWTRATITGTANQVVVTNGDGSITLSLPQSIATSSSPTFATPSLTSATLSALTASRQVFSDGSKVLTSTPPAMSTWAPDATGNGAMTATADSVYSARYQRNGNFIEFFVGMSFTVGGTPNTTINIPAPVSGTAHNTNLTFACAGNDGGGSGLNDLRWRYDGTNFIVFKAGLANWTAGASAAIFIDGKYEL